LWVPGLQAAPGEVEVDGHPLPSPAAFDAAARTLSFEAKPFGRIAIRLAPEAPAD
jgi:hypothetical protein